MRIRVISDLHGAVEHLDGAAEGVDALVVLGDLINVLDYRTWDGILVEAFGREPVMEAAGHRAAGRFDDAREAFRSGVDDLEEGRDRFMALAREQYERVLAALPDGTYLTYGNVDIPELLRELLPRGLSLLDGEAIDLGGMRFGFVGGGIRTPLGIPGEVEEDAYDAKLAAVGPVDVICTHMPPRIPWFVYDVVARKFEPGSTGLLGYIQEHQPRYALFGHVHNPLATRGTIGRTEVVNVGHFQAHGGGFTLDTAAG